MEALSVDNSTVIVLAAIALVEGLARVPAGALVLRRILLGNWQVSGLPASESRLQLVHWWPPWTDTLVLSSSNNSEPLTRAELQERLRAIAPTRRAARVVGAVTLIVLVIGIPAGLGLAGVIGGLVAAGCMLVGQMILGVLGWHGLRAIGSPWRARIRLAAQALNPFAAPAVASRLFAAAASGATPLTVAQTLLPPDHWLAWFRRRAYDAAVALTPDRELETDLEGAQEAIASALAQRPRMESDHRWCPRCAATYQAGTIACLECEVLLLTAAESAVPVGLLSRVQ